MHYNKKDAPCFDPACDHSHSNCLDLYSHQKSQLLLLCGTNLAKNHRKKPGHHQMLNICLRNFHMVQDLCLLSEMSSTHSHHFSLQPLPKLQNHNTDYLLSNDAVFFHGTLRVGYALSRPARTKGYNSLRIINS